MPSAGSEELRDGPTLNLGKYLTADYQDRLLPQTVSVISLHAQQETVQVYLTNGPSWPTIIISALSAIVAAATLIVAVITARQARADRDKEVQARKEAERKLDEAQELAAAQQLAREHAIGVAIESAWVGLLSGDHHRDVSCTITNHTGGTISNLEIYVRYPIVDDIAGNRPMSRLARCSELRVSQSSTWSQQFYVWVDKIDSNTPPPAIVYFTDYLGNRWSRDTSNVTSLVKHAPVVPNGAPPDTGPPPSE